MILSNTAVIGVIGFIGSYFVESLIGEDSARLRFLYLYSDGLSTLCYRAYIEIKKNGLYNVPTPKKIKIQIEIAFYTTNIYLN